MTDLQDRLRGIAVGAAVGDALGMPLEFHPPRAEYERVSEMLDGPLPAGCFTDDTEMALALAESLLAASPLDAHDLIGRFVIWYRSHPEDIGIHTSAVLAKIDAGVPVTEAVRQVQALEPDSAGNGSLMRAWPIAIARHNNESLLAAETRIQSEITHAHPDCTNGSLLFNLILYHLLHSNEHSTDAALRLAIARAVDQVSLGEDFAVVVNLAPLRQAVDLKNSGWVCHTIESALWAVQTTRSFEEALLRVINLGNDADTAGAVAGAIAGALYGLSHIPQRWRQAVHGEYPIRTGKLWFEQDFIQLADRLAALE